MKKITLIIGLLIFTLSPLPHAQKPIRNQKKSDGNYIEKTTVRSRRDKDTRKTYTNSKGTVYKVFEENNGRRYIWVQCNNRFTKHYLK